MALGVCAIISSALRGTGAQAQIETTQMARKSASHQK
jgi:hypothetical protein